MSIQGSINQVLGVAGLATKGSQLVKGVKSASETLAEIKLDQVLAEAEEGAAAAWKKQQADEAHLKALKQEFGDAAFDPVQQEQAAQTYEEFLMEERAMASAAMKTEQGMKTREAVKAQRAKLITDPAEVNAYMKQRGVTR